MSRIMATLRGSLEAWQSRSLADLEVVYLYLDALALRVRSAGKVVSVPVLGVVGVLVDGRKHLLTLELCGGESYEAWKGVLDGLVARGAQGPAPCIIDGHSGCAGRSSWCGQGRPCSAAACRSSGTSSARRPSTRWPNCGRISTGSSTPGLDAARAAWTAFERKWTPRCPGVTKSLREGGEELLTFFRFPRVQWKTLRTTNVIERLHEEFRRRVKTQGALPTEDAAVLLLFGLVATGQIILRKIDGYTKLAQVIRERMRPAA
jgi:transposase-like protein